MYFFRLLVQLSKCNMSIRKRYIIETYRNYKPHSTPPLKKSGPADRSLFCQQYNMHLTISTIKSTLHKFIDDIEQFIG